jgi:hypothetical protein
MSLGKLLATGRSLVGGAPDAGRYNISERNRLPKFGAAKNPFAQPAAPEAPEVVTRIEPAPASVPAPVAPPRLPPVNEFHSTAPAPMVAKVKLTERMAAWLCLARVGARRVAAVVWPWLKAMAARLGGWFGRAAGWFKRREPKPLIPRFGNPAVQPELLLDNVKVLRSDLVESDLEVIEADTSTGTRSSPRKPVATPKRGPVPPALKKLTDRILGPQLQ